MNQMIVGKSISVYKNNQNNKNTIVTEDTILSPDKSAIDISSEGV